MLYTLLSNVFIKTQPSINQTALTKPIHHSRGHCVEKLFFKISNHLFYIPHLPFWFSIFIHDCIECQTNKQFPFKTKQVSPPLPFNENATHFIYRISRDKKGPLALLDKITPIFCNH